MNVEYIPVGKLKPYDKNTRKHEDYPKYCDVIIKRYENLTGQKAVKIS